MIQNTVTLAPKIQRVNGSKSMRTNLINIIETHLPDERKAVAERRAEIETELEALKAYDATLAAIEAAVNTAPQKLTLTRGAGRVEN